MQLYQIISSGPDVEDCLVDVVFLYDFASYPDNLGGTWVNYFINDVAEELEAIGYYDVIYGLVTFKEQVDVRISLSQRMDRAAFAGAISSIQNPPWVTYDRADEPGVVNAIQDFDDK
jgi:hypothetical protein